MRTIRRLVINKSLANLIEYASSLTSPVLIGIDAAIGFPIASWQRLTLNRRDKSDSFIDYLLSPSLPPDFFESVATPDKWSPQRPFIRPPAGPWSLKAFAEASYGGLYREIDSRLKGKPIFVTSGIPGSVGSGTRALWQELIALGDAAAFCVWPFHGHLSTLLKADAPVIAEIYPKALYGIALAESLPAPVWSVAKTHKSARQEVLERLRNAAWIARERVAIEGFDAALGNEDDFDALLSAAALMRIFLENAPLEIPDTPDAMIEGSVLGAASLTTSAAQRVTGKLPKKKTAQPTDSTHRVQTYRCPIPGCQHVFHNTRGGWDAHVASLRRHPEWHPTVHDPIQRKCLFKKRFPDWFRH